MSESAAAIRPRLARALAGFPLRLGVLLTAAMAASSILQFAIGALGPTLTDDLDISRPELGIMIAIYYVIAAGLSGVLGRWTDAIDAGRVLAAVFAAAGVSLVIAAAAPTYLSLLIALLPAGAAAAAANPVTNNVLAGLSGDRGVLTGLKQSGVHLGALVAGGLAPPLAAWLGWRPALVLVAALCFAGIALVGWLPQRRSAGASSESSAAPVEERAPIAIVRLGVYAFATGAGVSTLMTFLPLYAHESLGLGRTAAGMLLAVMSVWGLASSMVWTSLAERRAGRGRGAGSPLWLLAAGAVLATALIAAAPELGAWSLWIAATMLGVTVVAANAVVMLVVVLSAPPGTAGHASGRVLTAFFVGLCVAGPVFGGLVDLTGAYLAGWLLTAAVFLGAALASLPFVRSPA